MSRAYDMLAVYARSVFTCEHEGIPTPAFSTQSRDTSTTGLTQFLPR
jgi:hypothetical protein